MIPLVVAASTRPSSELLPLVDTTTTLIAGRTAIGEIGATDLLASGRIVTAEPNVHHRTPGCDCCAVREDLVAAVLRATRRTDPPARVIVLLDPVADDILTAVTTILSSPEIARRCELDSVVLGLDAVELATRLTVGNDLAMTRPDDPDRIDGLGTALAIADRILIQGPDRVTSEMATRIRDAVLGHAGFGTIVDAQTAAWSAGRLEAWHGTPLATSIESDRAALPTTAILRVDAPLDSEAIDEWLDLLVARHASRLFRIQGALSVAGNDERTCCYGVRSFATSHSEREHRTRRSTESVLAICGVGLDVDELAAGFRATVAS